MSLPESVLPLLADDAFAATANALGELPCGPPYSPKYVQSVLAEQKPTTFDGVVKALGSAGSSTLAFVASVYKDAPRTAATLAGPFTVTEPTGHAGDLHIQGDLTLEKPLVVVGDLTVDGVLHDGEHTQLVVVGQVRCRAMYTSGWVTILGGLTVEHALYGRYNDDSVEVLGPITAGLIVSDDHLIYGKPKTAKLRPSQGGAWGPDTFDARDRAHKAELPKVLVDGITSLDEDGEVKVDGEKLVAARPPWK